MLAAVVLIALTAAGCQGDIEDLSTHSSAVDRIRVGDLTFTLQILNMQGEPQAVFEEGENFQFQFIIENRGDSAYALPVAWDFPTVNEEFFKLYRRTNESGGKANLGKSFRSGSNFTDLHRAWVPARGAAVYTIPWLTKKDITYIMPTYIPEPDSRIKRYYMALDHPPGQVGPGAYFTGFTLKHTDTDSVRMEVSFQVF